MGDPATTFSDRVREYRARRGMSASDLARETHFLKQTIYKYERRIIKNVPFDVVKRIADVLDVNPAYLVGWTDDPEYPANMAKEPIPEDE